MWVFFRWIVSAPKHNGFVGRDRARPRAWPTLFGQQGRQKQIRGPKGTPKVHVLRNGHVAKMSKLRVDPKVALACRNRLLDLF